MYDDEFKSLDYFSFFFSFFFFGLCVENAYNAVQDILSVYGLAMSTSDIMDAFNKKNDATAVSIRDLANSCEYFIIYLILLFCTLIHGVHFFPLSKSFHRSLSFIYKIEHLFVNKYFFYILHLVPC